jgi:hypothetical protein
MRSSIAQRLVERGVHAPAEEQRLSADLDLETRLLPALFDGIALHAVTVPDQMPPTLVRRLLEHHLARLRVSG